MADSSDDTRQRILDAALQLFGTTGYARATTRSIAEQAGVNEVTLFRHFGSKKNLLKACMETGNQRGFAQVFEEHLTGDYAADIRMMARLQMTDTLEHFELLRLLLCDAQSLPDLKAAMAAGAGENLARLISYFQQQIDAGVIQPQFEAAILAHAFDSLFSSYILFEHLMGMKPLNDTPDDTVIDSLATLFIQGTRAK